MASLGEPVTIWPFETGSDDAADSPIPADGLRQLLERGAASAVSEADVEAARKIAGLADTATLVYTSGTTGRPKGCVMTHANFSEVAVNLAPHMAKVLGDGERTLMFLPLAHVFARAVQQVCLHAGSTIAHTPSAATLVEDMKAVKPGFLLAVPRIFEKIRATAFATAEAAGKGALFAQAEAVAIEYSKAADARGRGERVFRSPVLLAKHALFNKVLYPKLRAVLGGHARYTISGASELNADLAHFFRGAGLGLLEGYGLTETTAPATVNLADDVRVGTVGIPIPGTTIRIAPDGEVLVKGIGVFAGYHNNPEASAGAFDADGFFKTGDTGALDESGFLSITGRKKDIIVTAGGKNVAPGPLEEYVRSARLVSQVVVVGENRPFVAALVTLDADELGPWCKANGLPPLSHGPGRGAPAGAGRGAARRGCGKHHGVAGGNHQEVRGAGERFHRGIGAPDPVDEAQAPQRDRFVRRGNRQALPALAPAQRARTDAAQRGAVPGPGFLNPGPGTAPRCLAGLLGWLLPACYFSPKTRASWRSREASRRLAVGQVAMSVMTEVSTTRTAMAIAASTQNCGG